MNRLPDFGSDLRWPFQIDERCYDCAELHHGCKAHQENPDACCLDYLRLPNAKVGTTGQIIPPSKMGGRKEPRICGGGAVLVQAQVEPNAAPAGRCGKPAKPKARTCGCGASLPKGKRLCDVCRTKSRQQTKRRYMRGYMADRRFEVIGPDSGVRAKHAATHTTQGVACDLPLTGHRVGVPHSEQTSVLTDVF